MTGDRKETGIGGTGRTFQPTLWTVVLRARDRSEPEGREALERLVSLYWKPIYFFVRRKGNGVEEAKDLTQGFFARLLEREALQDVDRAKGKFRTFLLAVLEHFLSDEYDRRRAKKRQAGFDFEQAERQYRPEQAFERDWALAILERAFVRLREENPRQAEAAGALRGEKVSYAELGKRLGVSEANVKVLVHRARRRLREILMEEVRGTVARTEDAQVEWAELFRVLSL